MLADGRLLNTLGGLTALDPRTGAPLSQTPAAGAAHGTPAVTRIGATPVLITPRGEEPGAEPARLGGGLL